MESDGWQDRTGAIDSPRSWLTDFFSRRILWLFVAVCWQLLLGLVIWWASS